MGSSRTSAAWTPTGRSVGRSVGQTGIKVGDYASGGQPAPLTKTQTPTLTQTKQCGGRRVHPLPVVHAPPNFGLRLPHLPRPGALGARGAGLHGRQVGASGLCRVLGISRSTTSILPHMHPTPTSDGSLPITAWASARIQRDQTRMMKRKDARMSIVNEVLQVRAVSGFRVETGGTGLSLGPTIMTMTTKTFRPSQHHKHYDDRAYALSNSSRGSVTSSGGWTRRGTWSSGS